MRNIYLVLIVILVSLIGIDLFVYQKRLATIKNSNSQVDILGSDTESATPSSIKDEISDQVEVAVSTNNPESINNQNTGTDSFALEPVNSIDFAMLNHAAKQILSLQKLGSNTLTIEQTQTLIQLQNSIYEVLIANPDKLYIESKLSTYMTYLTPDQIKKIERLRRANSSESY